MSPEMIEGKYYNQSDIWSIGVILFLMVTGNYAFHAKTKEKLYEKIQEGKYNEEKLIQASCSDELKDLIK